MFILDRIDRELLHSLERLELKFGLSSEFFDKIPVRILLDVLFRVFRFSKAFSLHFKTLLPSWHWDVQVVVMAIVKLQKILNFGCSKHWNSVFCFSRLWNSVSWLFQTVKSWILAVPNIGILNCGFFKHCNSGFSHFQTLEFLILAFPNSVNSWFYYFQT